MKIRGKLITAFFIMTIIPIALIFLCVTAILNRQNAMFADDYNMEDGNIRNYDIVLNPVSFFYNIALPDYQSIYKITQSSPNKLLDKQFLEQINDVLLRSGSYLIVVKDKTYYYVGSQEKFKKLGSLPLQSIYDENASRLTYIDNKSNSIIKEIVFGFSDKTTGQAFLVIDFSDIQPRWFTVVRDIALAIFFILLSTGTLLVIWIYQSILRPLNTLRLATMQIGAGDLNEPIHIYSSDEIGKLCCDFEEMRIRLKNMVEERIQSEENTREIISNISHDLKTPITAIKGYTEGILDGVADTAEKQQKYLQTIYAKANDITYLIDELSLFSKVERNSFAYNFVSVNLERYFTDCIEDVSLDLESKNITIDYYNTTDKDTCILADTEQLKRVLHNIIENAAKYNDKPDGHISVRIEEVKRKPVAPPLYRQLKEDGSDLFPQQPPDEFIQVQIEDNGPGIAAKDLPHIFDRFYRADVSRNSSKRGSGLGLAIVRMIISDHGGKVWAESIEGVGTSFYFTLKKEARN
ncbi:sensor histidine kinase [bacterium D16-51]|nr:sensor histidine kinase [bacterium D16-59]RKI60283.1 sensor histidine kinase [bacterium D16-51]